MVCLMAPAIHQQRQQPLLMGARLAQKLLCHCRRLQIKRCRWSHGCLQRRFPSQGRQGLLLPLRRRVARA
jgi:hypothetical protein